MENKLQELTDKLYNEGLSKGKAEGEVLLAKAKSDAAEIVAAAEKEAKEIIAKAEKQAADYKTKVAGDLKMAASQSIQATRKGYREPRCLQDDRCSCRQGALRCRVCERNREGCRFQVQC